MLEVLGPFEFSRFVFARHCTLGLLHEGRTPEPREVAGTCDGNLVCDAERWDWWLDLWMPLMTLVMFAVVALTKKRLGFAEAICEPIFQELAALCATCMFFFMDGVYDKLMDDILNDKRIFGGIFALNTSHIVMHIATFVVHKLDVLNVVFMDRFLLPMDVGGYVVYTEFVIMIMDVCAYGALMDFFVPLTEVLRRIVIVDILPQLMVPLLLHTDVVDDIVFVEIFGLLTGIVSYHVFMGPLGLHTLTCRCFFMAGGIHSSISMHILDLVNALIVAPAEISDIDTLEQVASPTGHPTSLVTIVSSYCAVIYLSMPLASFAILLFVVFAIDKLTFVNIFGNVADTHLFGYECLLASFNDDFVLGNDVVFLPMGGFFLDKQGSALIYIIFCAFSMDSSALLIIPMVLLIIVYVIDRLGFVDIFSNINCRHASVRELASSEKCCRCTAVEQVVCRNKKRCCGKGRAAKHNAAHSPITALCFSLLLLGGEREEMN